MPGDTPRARRLMSEEVSFRLAIARDPSDQNARLAFRDWLDDREDPWGRFIRIDGEIEAALAASKKSRSEFNGLSGKYDMIAAQKAVSELRQERERLLANLTWRIAHVDCVACESTGAIKGGRGTITCPYCDGARVVDGIFGPVVAGDFRDGHMCSVTLSYNESVSGALDPSRRLVRILRWHPIETINIFGPIDTRYPGSIHLRGWINVRDPSDNFETAMMWPAIAMALRLASDASPMSPTETTFD